MRAHLYLSVSAMNKQVAQLWLTDRATAYVQKVQYAVVGTVSGSVQAGQAPETQ